MTRFNHTITITGNNLNTNTNANDIGLEISNCSSLLRRSTIVVSVRCWRPSSALHGGTSSRSSCPLRYEGTGWFMWPISRESAGREPSPPPFQFNTPLITSRRLTHGWSTSKRYGSSNGRCGSMALMVGSNQMVVSCSGGSGEP